jgi:hypothetical protein
MDRLVGGETNRSPPASHELLPELYKRGVATFKERTQGVVRKIHRSARCLRIAGWAPQFADFGSEDVVVGEGDVNVAALLNSVPMSKLQRLFSVALLETRVKRAAFGGKK